MKTKILIITIITTLICTGCCLKHKWEEATCATPRTCMSCGETEGDTLEHTWQFVSCTEADKCTECGAVGNTIPGHKWENATCTTPKTCTVCGTTEGDIEHTFSEATCWSPAICSGCGAMEGDVLLPVWQDRVIDVLLEKEYSVEIASNSQENTVQAGVTFSDYVVFEENDAHSAKEGYVWRTIKTTTTYTNSNITETEMGLKIGITDFYYDDLQHQNITEMEGTFVVSYEDELYSDCSYSLVRVWTNDEKEHTSTCTDEWTFLLPVDYDGLILGYYQDEMMDESAVIVRLVDEIKVAEKKIATKKETTKASSNYDSTTDPNSPNFDPYNREGFVYIPGFGYINATPSGEPESVQIGETIDFYETLNDPNNPIVGY